MSLSNNTLLHQLLQLAGDLRAQTQGYDQQQEDGQPWYDRGYADGIVKALYDMGYGGEVIALGGPKLATVSEVSSHVPWGEAYHHGLQMGERETREVLDPPQ